jgi:vacuolar-type H+-ATPase subunit D/Vma8
MSINDLEKKVETRIKALAEKIWIDQVSQGVSKVEAWQMACQQLQVEFAAKQAVAQVSIQFLLSDLLRRSEPKPVQ